MKSSDEESLLKVCNEVVQDSKSKKAARSLLEVQKKLVRSSKEACEKFVQSLKEV
jgi:hypothetical protein